ncbi:hypothetical protein [Paracoccus sp. NSM]|uniref:hypothetical protein n=1 Tax=Paracoccus sp. NSM TaxID=3457784 RepID=UPI0040362321
MTPQDQSIAFMRVVRSGRFTLREIAERAGLSVDQAREVLFRGVQKKLLIVNDADRQNIVIEIRKREAET